MSMCVMCAAQLPSSCLTGSCDATDTLLTEESTTQVTHSRTVLGIEITDGLSDGISTDDSSGSNNEHRKGSSGRGGNRGSRKRAKSDSQSAGRKIAAREYPLNGDAPCEWQNQGNCGGGDYPILGCLDGKQQARHHGPEKNVHNNEKGNVHRICHYCHYRWHAANDPTYDWNAGVWPPHNPRPLTEKEKVKQAIDNMRYLTSGRKAKVKELD
jgi:hypothetical protein